MKTPQQAVSTSRPDVSTSTDSQRLPQGSSTRTDCLSAVEARRSYRRLSSASPIPDSRLLDIVRSIVKFSPSSHNSQSTRLLILLGNDHKEFWDITLSTLKGMVSSSRIGPTEEKIQGLRSAYGTILCYEDLATVRKLENSYPLYKDNFMSWSEQTNAMHQILLWTALESEGLGCTLQHYNPLIDEKIAIRWNVSSDWSLKGQLVFGIPSGTPEPKTYKPLEERIIVFGGEL
ncbi:nitroreductase [Cadophora sp. MPI-SDFR-AT-0126]|nr:nitroreductase [Leotiomycetes sp. MPI-SDFR-AT-0126]